MKRKTLLVITLVLIICTNNYAQFQDHIIIDASNGVDGVSSVFAADLDGDGDLDMLSSSLVDAKIAWYENTDGLGNFGSQQTITINALAANAVYATDIDGDGDMDVLSASLSDDKIAWYENTDGLGNFGTQLIITTNADSAESVYAADIDGDGDMDVLSASSLDNKIAWYENADGLGTFGAQQIISTNVDKPSTVRAADIDGDGDMDVVSASFLDNKVAWYENTDGLGSFGAQQIITTNALSASSIHIADINGDGDMDVVSTSFIDDKVAWYENTDGLGSFGAQQIITTNADGAKSVYVTDIDGDGDMDVLAAALFDQEITWYENTNGLGNFSSEQIITTIANGARSVFAGDIDGDGDIDVMSASIQGDDKVAWYENTDGQGAFGSQQIVNTNADNPRAVYTADIDGDGDMDVLSASIDDDKIAWYENTDGEGTFGSQQVITLNAASAVSVFATDIDGDGDMDVLSASIADDKIAWYENTDGQGSFSSEQIISTIANGARSVFAADLDNDGDMDVLSASIGDDKIAWYENTDGLGNFSSQKIITTAADGTSSVYASDIDGDGDMDVLSASIGDDKIAWYRNNGSGNFGAQLIISAGVVGARAVYAADIDGDGDMDVLAASDQSESISWFENTNGSGNFGTRQIITDNANAGAESVYATDMDGDGDIDIIATSFSDDDNVFWYENTDGQGSFSSEQIISTNANDAVFVYVADIDGDGDMDVLSASIGNDAIMWHENSIVLGIDENTLLDFSIYPVPTSSILTVKSKNIISRIEVYSQLGQLVLENENEHSIDVSILSQGFYFIKIKDENGDFGVKKIVKK